MIELAVHYAPVVVVVIAILFKGKLFITPEQLDKKISEVTERWEDKYLTIVAFREFEKRISEHFSSNDKRLDEISSKNDKIIELIMKGKNDG